MSLENNPFPEECPTIYFNGFAIGLGTGDIVISLQLNGKSSHVLNASYTVAKTLAERLTKAIGELEQKTGNTIMTVQNITDATIEDGTES